LKYSFWQDYRSGSQNNVNTETNVAVAVPKTLTEEERMKLIEQREKSQNKVEAVQDKPKVLEAQVIEPEPESVKTAPAAEPEVGEFDSSPEAEKEAAKERPTETQRRADAIRIRDLGF
jgi:hypothetical protein